MDCTCFPWTQIRTTKKEKITSKKNHQMIDNWDSLGWIKGKEEIRGRVIPITEG